MGTRKIVATGVAFMLVFCLSVACQKKEEESAAEKVGKKIEESAETMKTQVEEAASKVEQGTRKAPEGC